MPLKSGWVLSQVIVDVQYQRGWTYFDRCGSLMLKLEETLGQPFSGSTPMEKGEIRNNAELLVASYSRQNFNVTQNWVKTPARVEHVASTAWQVVADSLGVGASVTRCAARFTLAAAVDSMDEGKKIISRLPAVQPNEALRKVAGGGQIAGFVAVFEEKGSRFRIGLDVQEVSVEIPLVADIADLIPKCSLTVDFDNVREGTPFGVEKGELREFIRSSWQRSRAAAKVVGDELGMEHA